MAMRGAGAAGLVAATLVCLGTGCGSKATPLDPNPSGSGGTGGTGGTAAVGGTAGTGLAGAGAVGGAGVSGGFGATGGGGATGGNGGNGGSTDWGKGNGLSCGETYQRPVDVLFVIDNSGSMREEQESLRVQIPRLIQSLATGTTGDGDQFIPVSDLHVGIVSTDLGLPQVPNRSALGCGDDSRPLGDDGVLRTAGNPGGAPGLSCSPAYPPFLNFMRSGDPMQDAANASALAADVSCVSSLGTTGCGFEMQMESMLRALWPSNNALPDGTTGQFADGRPFVDGTMFGQAGPSGANTGFLRNDPNNPSLLAVVLVTDEEDCSSHNMGHFVPEQFLATGDPLKTVGLNLRCFNESQRMGPFPQGENARDSGQANLYSVSRYAQALLDLRGGNRDLVVFAAIAGIPTDLAERQQSLDFSNASARDAYYADVLSDQRMIEMPDPNTLTGNPNLIPSCLRNVPGSDVPQRAFPPRRIVKIARELGENAVVQSICTDDFTPAINGLIARIGDVIHGECPLE